jgi:hypothetical protein
MLSLVFICHAPLRMLPHRICRAFATSIPGAQVQLLAKACPVINVLDW